MKSKLLTCFLMIILISSVTLGALGISDADQQAPLGDDTSSKFDSSMNILDVSSADSDGIYDSEKNLISTNVEILVGDAEGLNKLSSLISTAGETNDTLLFTGYTCSLTADIALDSTFSPIGYYGIEYDGEYWQTSFDGTFNGNGHTISGLTVSEHGAEIYIGLFRLTGEHSSIHDLNVVNAEISVSGDFVLAGIVCGYNCGIITGCEVSGSISVTSEESYAGGIAGHTYVSISSCRSSADVSSTGTVENSEVYIGGIVGCALYDPLLDSIFSHSSCVISDCHSSGNISAVSTYRAYAGGISGVSLSIIYGCSNSGTVSASVEYSGNAESSAGTRSSAGGISGQATYLAEVGMSDLYISDCCNTGNISSSTTGTIDESSKYTFAGGITGRSYVCLSNCYNTGSAHASGGTEVDVGGIAGKMSSDAPESLLSLISCYNLGIIAGTDSEKVRIGSITGFVKNTALSEVYGLNGTADEIIGMDAEFNGSFMTSEDMKNEEFINTLNTNSNSWIQDTKDVNNGYPILKSINYADEQGPTGPSEKSNDYSWVYWIIILAALVIGVLLALSYNSKR